MKIATWNVNGIRARETQLCEWLERDRPDVVCLQELKAEPAQIPARCSLEDYYVFWHGRRAYSGVSLHFRKSLFDVEPQFSHPAFDMESRIVQAQWGNVVFASVYVPNGGKDYAAKLAFLSQRPEERDLFANLIGEHLVDVGRALAPDKADLYTWWPPWRNMRQRNIGWRIDYILAAPTIAARVESCAVLSDIGTSDHAPVMATIA
jgi:exodeoxyribonuclease-3